ncbi:MAG: sugar ABC transporter substrate-binding protein [Bacillota bacterium]
MNSAEKKLFMLFGIKRISLLFRGLMLLLFLVLAVAFAVSMTYSMVLEEDFYKIRKADGSGKEYEKNLLVVMYQTSDDFMQKFRQGIYKYAEEKHILIDFVNVEDINEAIDSINTAVAAKVDGIIAQGIYDAEYIKAINKAIEKGITVEFAYTDAMDANRVCFVGFNAYDYGKKAARCAIHQLPGMEGNIALMLQSFAGDEKDITSSLFIEGFKSITDKYPKVKLVDILRTSYDLFSAEDMTYEILSRHPDIDAIVCTSEKDVFGAAQVVIDLNRVGNIKLIGAGVSKDITRYIRLGVIAASFDMNPELMSEKCIEIMAGDKVSSDYVEIPIEIVTANNVADYAK